MKFKISVGIILTMLMLIAGPSSLSAAEFESCSTECGNEYGSEVEDLSDIGDSHPLAKCLTACSEEDPKGYADFLLKCKLFLLEDISAQERESICFPVEWKSECGADGRCTNPHKSQSIRELGY